MWALRSTPWLAKRAAWRSRAWAYQDARTSAELTTPPHGNPARRRARE